MPGVLFSPVNAEKFRALFDEYLDKAEAHLAAGWHYANMLPYGQFRVRLACAWPILFGMRTIAKLRVADGGEMRARVKITRGEVWGILLHSLAVSPVPFLWRRLFVPTRKAVASSDKLA